MALGDYIPWRKSEAGATGAQHPLSRLQGELNNLIESFMRNPLAAGGASATGGYVPPADIVETPETVELSAELPGLEPNEVEVSIAEDSVTISGEKHSETEATEETGFYRVERSYGRFERTIPLPVEVRVDEATATFKNGVLKVTLPKEQASKRNVRKVEVRSG